MLASIGINTEGFEIHLDEDFVLTLLPSLPLSSYL